MLTNVEIPRKEFPDFAPGPVPADVAAQRERDAARRETVRTEQNRLITPPPALVGDRDESKFPGGLVPSAQPVKRLGGRLRSRRR